MRKKKGRRRGGCDAEWAEAKRRCRLNQEDIRMARELGFSPRALLNNIPSPSQPWKAPVKEWILGLYERRTRTHEAASRTRPKDQVPRLTTDPDELPEGATAMVEFPLSALFPDGRIPGLPDVMYDPDDVLDADALPNEESDLDGEDLPGEDWDEGDPFFEDDGPSSKEIREQDERLLRRQRDFRAAAEALARAFAEIPEVQKVVLFGSAAVPLKKEVPRFQEFRRVGIEVFHECKDLDLAVWLTDLACLRALQKARAGALRKLQERQGASVAHHQADVFIFDPKRNRYLGRLCKFNACPKGKDKCRVPGCGATKFLQKHERFAFKRGALEPGRSVLLFDRSLGATVEETQTRRPKKDEAREHRISMEIVVDAYNEDERALVWYYHLDDHLCFPFRAKCIARRAISPLRVGDEVEVVGMPLEEECMREMFVAICREGGDLAVPLSQLTVVEADDATIDAVEDWHYWVNMGYEF